MTGIEGTAVHQLCMLQVPLQIAVGCQLLEWPSSHSRPKAGAPERTRWRKAVAGAFATIKRQAP
jgi:hypothetical protein